MTRAKALSVEERIVRDMRAAFKADDVALLMAEGGFARVREVCPTGHLVLDHHVVGIGGLPYGQITEVLGVESAGKSTLLASFIAAAQRDGAVTALADPETTFDPKWAALLGVDVSRLILYDPETLEDYHEQTDHLLARRPTNRRMAFFLDSIAMLPTRNEMKPADENKGGQAEHARVWTDWGRQFKRRLYDAQAMMVWVNQPRSKVGVMYGPSETSFGGRWLRHAPALRLYVSHGKAVDGKDGRYMHVRADKNKLAPPHRAATLLLRYREGFDLGWSVIDHAKEVGCLDKKKPNTDASLREALANLGWSELAAPPAAPEGGTDAAGE